MKKILIIEDDELIAKVYGTKYAAAGFETATAADGEQGLSLLKTFKPDLVHLDLSVPKVNGAEIIKQIRAQPELASLPVVVLSNTYQNRLVKAAMDAGATECVSKATCTPKMMIEIVEKHRARMEAQRPAPPPTPEPVSAEPVAKAPPVETPDSHAPVISLTTEVTRHEAFQAETRSDFVKRAPRLLAKLHERAEAFERLESQEARLLELSKLYKSADSLAGQAGLAGFAEVAHLSCALAALLKDLSESPSDLTPSALLTIVDASDSLAAALKRAIEGVSETNAPRVVLVVDDEVISRQAVCRALTRLNVATISVDDPKAALALLRENHFSLIFLDVEMPGLDGFELCRELRALPGHKTSPVVFVSGRGDLESREKAAAVGGNDLIAKPFLAMELAVKALGLLR